MNRCARRSDRVSCLATRRREQGLATILISIVLLAAITVMVIFAAQTAVLDQRMSANEMRMKQASGAAQSGIETAMAQLNSGQGLPGEPLARNFDDPGESRSQFRVAFLDPESEIDPCPEDPADFSGNSAVSTLETLLFSCGWSDDLSARKGIVVLMRASPSLGNPPTNPLTSLGGVTTNGAARVFNYFNNLTIWTAQSTGVSGNPGTTYVRDQSVNPPSDMTAVTDNLSQPNINDYYLQTTDASLVGPDVIDGDLSLRSLEARGGDAFFENFLGTTRDDYQAQSISVDNADDLDGMSGQAIWFDTENAELSGGTIGSREEPVVLVVSGDLRVTGNVDIYGVVYVAGDLRGSGTFNNFGSSIIEGETLIGGNPSFIFDPDIAFAAGNVGVRGIVTGTWRDWADFR